ncbi:MAG: molybdopterin-dependent oxidoreductase [Solirubrobacteraceae bacterium]
METFARTCPLCEATCGLQVSLEGEQVHSIRPDPLDVFSRGFICPKGVSLKELHEDPDRLRTPLLRNGEGGFDEISWERAFAELERRLPPIIERHGRDAVAVYLGNPNAHLLANLIYSRVLLRTLGSHNVYSASTVDQFPKQMAAAYMFGGGSSVPVPDLDNTHYLLMLGANPLASNGSLMTAPDARGRLRAIQARGGRIVVIDPRRSRTAELADEHHFIRPGTDALLLFALVHTLWAEDLARPAANAPLNGLGELQALAEPFSPAAVQAACGIAAEDIRRIARELAGAPSGAVYGRIGTCTQEFGTLSSWLVDVLNLLTGNLDRRGGAMFPKAAAGASNTQGAPGRGRGARFGRFSSRVRGLGELFGELPVACLAEEIDTPGPGQVRAFICLAGNPALSTPNAGRLTRALDELEFMVSLDIYVNETSRHADLILPGPSPLECSHYDLALYQFAVRNVANYSPALLPAPVHEWETILRLTVIIAGQGAEADIAALDDLVAGELARRECSVGSGPLAGRDAAQVLAELAPRRGPERILDLMLRAGPYELTLADLEAAPHGIDLGPLQPRLPEVLRTASGAIELTPQPLVDDVARLRAALAREAGDGLVLIGRRHLRSNNSWLHNLPLLVRGPQRCTVQVNTGDAARLGLADGEPARVSSRTGAVELPVEVTDAIMPGVVSIPHGWGHDQAGSEIAVAAAHAGANSNLLADEELIDVPSGNAVLNGIPVVLAPVAALV